MPTVTYVDSDGTRTDLNVPVGVSVMKAAIENGIDGIEAECGGSLACATCHVFVDEAWASRLSVRSDSEDDMLECAATPPNERSRLSCQILMTPELDGLIVHLPETQA